MRLLSRIHISHFAVTGMHIANPPKLGILLANSIERLLSLFRCRSLVLSWLQVLLDLCHLLTCSLANVFRIPILTIFVLGPLVLSSLFIL